MRDLMEKFSVMCDWNPPVAISTLIKIKLIWVIK